MHLWSRNFIQYWGWGLEKGSPMAFPDPSSVLDAFQSAKDPPKANHNSLQFMSPTILARKLLQAVQSIWQDRNPLHCGEEVAALPSSGAHSEARTLNGMTSGYGKASVAIGPAPTQGLPGPSGPEPRKSPKRVRKEYPRARAPKVPKECAPESEKSPKYSWEYFMQRNMHNIFLCCGQPEYFRYSSVVGCAGENWERIA